jgi:hypothetical protein
MLPGSAFPAYTTDKLPFGTYHLTTTNSSGYVNEVFDNILCTPACAPASGTDVVISTIGGATANFALQSARTISGKVTDAATMSGIANRQVRVLNSSGAFLGSAVTNSAGAYTIPTSLVNGAYYLYTQDFDATSYIDERYDGARCDPGCTVVSGPGVTIDGITPATVDFALALGGRISGTVTDSFTGENVIGAPGTVVVHVFDAAGTEVTSSAGNNFSTACSPLVSITSPRRRTTSAT